VTAPAERRVTDRPRRCPECDAPVIESVDGTILDDRPALRGTEHRCAA
jgi:hypothetical protein